MNLITGWDLVEKTAVQPARWLLVTAGHSSVAMIISQLAQRKGVNVKSVVRKARENFDLRSVGATEIIELSQAEKNLGDIVANLTEGAGVSGIVDCVGGSLLGDLVPSLAMGGQVIIYGGYRPDTFALHNFDLLMRNATITSYVYRYFFSPPPQTDAMTLLRRIAEISSDDDFQLPVGRTHSLDDFKIAVEEAIRRPEQGKRMFKME
ncbi:zinc-binding dehydrogenase [Acidobacteria bacterium AB60]|nr:zinc-binding dehydrogenase [Acidobacteria bacterium AB60]